MNGSHVWELSKAVSLPSSVVPQAPDNMWMVGQSAQLLRLDGNGTVTPMSVQLGGAQASLVAVSAGKPGELLLIVEGANNTHYAARFEVSSGKATKLALPKEPRRLVWVEHANAVWYLSTDTSLNSFPTEGTRGEAEETQQKATSDFLDGTENGGQPGPLREGGYNTLVASGDGSVVAVRDIASDDLYVTSTKDMKWRKALAKCTAEIAGFDKEKNLVLLERNPWLKGSAAPPTNKIVRLATDGTQKVLAEGPWVTAFVTGDTLALVHTKTGERFAVEGASMSAVHSSP